MISKDFLQKSCKVEFKKNMKKILLIQIVVFTCFYWLSAKSEEDLINEKIKYKELIAELKSNMKTEDQNFRKNKKNKRLLINQKKKELKNLEKEIITYNQKLKKVKFQIDNLSFKIKKLQDEDSKLVQFYLSLIKENIKEVNRGIPFEREQRVSILNAIVLDIDKGKLLAMDTYSRYLENLVAEENLAYDTKVIQSILKINGKNKGVTILKIGRVFFAVLDKKEVYLYRKVKGKYLLYKGLTKNQKDAIKDTIATINGKKTPSFLSLPFLIGKENLKAKK